LVALVTDDGLANIMAAWNAYVSRMRYLEFGTGSGQDATSDDLAAVSPELAVLGATSVETVNVAGDTYRVTGAIAATAARAITEVGVFDAVGGNLGIYGDFAAINLAQGDAITFQVNVTVS
jgi:hypothetical protein